MSERSEKGAGSFAGLFEAAPSGELADESAPACASPDTKTAGEADESAAEHARESSLQSILNRETGFRDGEDRVFKPAEEIPFPEFEQSDPSPGFRRLRYLGVGVLVVTGVAVGWFSINAQRDVIETAKAPLLEGSKDAESAETPGHQQPGRMSKFMRNLVQSAYGGDTEAPPLHENSTAEAFLTDIHRSEIQGARDALWKFALATKKEQRIPYLASPGKELPLLEEYYSRFENGEAPTVSNVSIDHIRSWPDEKRLGVMRHVFNVQTNFNPDGFIVYVESEDEQQRISWARYIQHHDLTFVSFLNNKPEGLHEFFLTVERKHWNEHGDQFEDHDQYDLYAISGVNPSLNFVGAMATKNIDEEKAHDYEATKIPWNEKIAVVAVIRWVPAVEDGSSLTILIEDVVSIGW